MKTDRQARHALPSAPPAARWRRTTPLRGMLCCVIAAVFTTSALFAEPKATAVLEPAEVRPGGFASYSITIEDGALNAVPTLKLPEGLQLANPEPGVGQQTTITNGVVRQSATLTWQISCGEAGEYTIPPQELVISGMPVKTEEATLVVKDNPAYPVSKYDPVMTLEAEKREFYLGEVIPITVNLYIHRNTLLRRVGLIELPKESFAIQRFPLQGEEGMVTMGGVPYRTMAYRSTLSALKPGKFKLGPATSEIIIEVPGGDGRTLHPFFTQTEPRKMKPTCNDIEVTVLPLPTEGVPKGFNHVVGDFDISVTAEPRDVALNDPISVEMTISGTGNFDAIMVPANTEPDSWKVYPARRFNVQSSDNPADGSARSIGFSQVMLPRKAVSAVPSFEFSFFSPSKKRYVTLRTQPIPITVKAPAPSVEPPPVSAATAASSSSAAEEADDKVPTVKPKITDILATVPQQPAWIVARPALWADRRFLVANLVAAGALALLVLGKFATAAWRAHVNSPLAPLRNLLRQMHSAHLSRGKFYALAASYISARGLSGDAVQSILDRHSVVNYGRPTGESTQQIPHDERSRVLEVLESKAPEAASQG